MGLTQKKMKEEIERIAGLNRGNQKEKADLLAEIKKLKDESNEIELTANRELMEKIDEYNGLTQTVDYFNGYLNALEWTLEEMRAKK